MTQTGTSQLVTEKNQEVKIRNSPYLKALHGFTNVDYSLSKVFLRRGLQSVQEPAKL